MSRAGFLEPLLTRAAAPQALVNLTRGTVVAGRVEGAFDSASRKHGLLGRDGLETENALVIAPCSGVHTFFMRFPIDVLFVARDGRVKKATRSVSPWRIALGLGSFAVVEGAPGMIERSGTRSGDQVALRPR
jgi:uncharacterized membrane protein (UPF0127 family)